MTGFGNWYLGLVILFGNSGFASAQIAELRNLFFSAKGDKAITAFYTAANAESSATSLITAYKGVSTAMYASTVISPISKLSYFKKGKAAIEQAVKGDSKNVEIRFLRLAIQSQIPAILGYSENIQEDLAKIIEACEQQKITSADPFWKKALTWISNHVPLDNNQKTKIKKFISA